eukprot:636508-Prymnesium_polylepis.1
MLQPGAGVAIASYAGENLVRCSERRAAQTAYTAIRSGARTPGGAVDTPARPTRERRTVRRSAERRGRGRRCVRAAAGRGDAAAAGRRHRGTQPLALPDGRRGRVRLAAAATRDERGRHRPRALV